VIEGTDLALLVDRLPYRPLGIETAVQQAMSAIQDAAIRHIGEPWPFTRPGAPSSRAVPYPDPEVVADTLVLRFDDRQQAAPIELSELPGYGEYIRTHPPLPTGGARS
jgi:hypothetical protein